MTKAKLSKADTIYVAGPMQGRPRHNWPAFDAAAATLRADGYRVISPADIDRSHGLRANTPDRCIDRKRCIANDIRVIMRRCTAIALLPGWRKSKGATVEVALGKFLGLQVFEYATMEIVK